MAKVLFLLLLLVTRISAAELSMQEIAKSVYAKQLVEFLGDAEEFKTRAHSVMAFMAKQDPKLVSLTWARVGAKLDADAFVAAMTAHYAENFTVDELRSIARLTEKPKMKALHLAVKAIPAGLSKAEVEEHVVQLKRRYGQATCDELFGFMSSALGNQLRSAIASAENLRRDQTIAAIRAAIDAVQMAPPSL